MKIMFICTGNICRSAMAHWLLIKKLQDEKINNIEVYSGGIYAEDGDLPTYDAIEVMKEYGVDLKQHKATNIANSKIEEMDLILCATNTHKIQLMHEYPELKNKIFTMKEYVNYNKEEDNNVNIQDPWGYGIDTYRRCATEIDDVLNLLIKKLEDRN